MFQAAAPASHAPPARRKPVKIKRRAQRPKVRAPAPPVPDRAPDKSVCWWSKPFLALASGAANVVLRIRGFHHRRVQTSSGTMHAVVCRGKGKLPTLVVLPGLGTRSTDYALMLWRLKPAFRRIVAIDLPGHGHSQLRVPIESKSFANAVLEAKKALAPGPVFVMGHSLGALATMKSYLLAPHEVLAMAVVTPPGAPVAPEVVERYSQRFDIRSWCDARVIADMTEPRNCWPHIFSPAALAQRLTRPPIRELLRSDVLTAPLTPDHLAQMPRHTMFVWAGREGLLPNAFGRYFRRHLPKTTRLWEPMDMTHGDIAWGSKKYLDPIIGFFKNADRDLHGRSRLHHRARPALTCS